MSTLTLQRCLHHSEREAVARCPECQQYFCRECIVEYEHRVVCADCRKKLAAPADRPKGSLRRLGIAVHVAVGILLLWFCFFMLGRTLLAIPSSFHDGDAWKSLRPAE